MEVHWHEGLFLRPQHLQAMQRSLGARFAIERALSRSLAWGVIECRVDAEQIAKKIIQIQSLRVITRSGLLVDTNENALLPPMSFGSEFEEWSAQLPGDKSLNPFVVRLGVPVYHSLRANVIESDEVSQGRRLYRVVERRVADDNKDEAEGDQEKLKLREINARLLAPGADDAGMETVPLLRVRDDGASAKVFARIDGEYTPPSLVISASERLVTWLRDVESKLKVTRDVAERELTQRAEQGPLKDVDVLNLQTLGRYWARLRTLDLERDVASPLELHTVFSQLLLELAAIKPGKLPQTPEYSHENPGPATERLVEQILERIGHESGPDQVIRLPLERTDRVFAAELQDAHLPEQADYFLAVHSGQDPAPICELVQTRDAFKIMSWKNRFRGTWGIPAVEERGLPPELMGAPGIVYFKLKPYEEPDEWEQIKTGRRIAIYDNKTEFRDITKIELIVLTRVTR